MDEKVLFVDDEQNVLSAIRRMLFEETYESFFACGGEEALAFLAKNQVQVIVSDMRMPIMDGVAFLKKSVEVCPDAIRIVLSGQADASNIMDTINQAGIWRYIAKPWNDNDMKLTIRNAFDMQQAIIQRRELLEELAVKNKILENVNEELERKVVERTRLINSQNRLLNLLVKGSELSIFLVEACSLIAEMSHSKLVLLFDKVNDKTYSSELQPSPDQSEILSFSATSGETIEKDNNLFIPLIQSEFPFGACMLQKDMSGSSEVMDSILKNIVPIIAIALSQNKSILDAPGLLNEIDNLIDNL